MTQLLNAKKIIIQTGKRLVSSNLTVRTWGNISMRIDENSFAITPSGYSYDNLKHKDIAVLNIKNPESTGGVKPSSERYIHAEIYKLKPNVNFIIHTHQKFATALSLFKKPIPVTDDVYKKTIGDEVPIVNYAPAGTKKLAKNVVRSLRHTDANCALMANHGAICFGVNTDETFLCAETLEDFCKQFIFKEEPALAEACKKYKKKEAVPFINLYKSFRDGQFCSVYAKDSNVLICRMDIETGTIQKGYFDFPSDLHRKIYAAYPKINYIEQSALPVTLYASKKLRNEKSIPAFLDDFAQIAGETIFCTAFFDSRAEELTETVIACLKNRNAVIISESGSLCCVSDYNDMHALQEILEKNLLIKMLSLKYKEWLPINQGCAKKLRKGYITSYSKIAFSKK